MDHPANQVLQEEPRNDDIELQTSSSLRTPSRNRHSTSEAIESSSHQGQVRHHQGEVIESSSQRSQVRGHHGEAIENQGHPSLVTPPRESDSLFTNHSPGEVRTSRTVDMGEGEGRGQIPIGTQERNTPRGRSPRYTLGRATLESTSSFKLRELRDLRHVTGVSANQQSMLRRTSFQFDGAGSFHVIPWSNLLEVGDGQQNQAAGPHGNFPRSSLGPHQVPKEQQQQLEHSRMHSSPVFGPGNPLRPTHSAASSAQGGSFSWFHLVIPRSCPSLSIAARQAITFLHPTLPLPHVVALLANGPFCSVLDGALIFRINSPGPLDSPYSFRIALRMTKGCVISLALGHIPRLELSRTFGWRGSVTPMELGRSAFDVEIDGGGVDETNVLLPGNGSEGRLGQRPEGFVLSEMPEGAVVNGTGAAGGREADSTSGGNLGGARFPPDGNPRNLFKTSPSRRVSEVQPKELRNSSGSEFLSKEAEEILSPDRIGLLQTSPRSHTVSPTEVLQNRDSALHGAESLAIDEQDLEDLLRGSHPEGADCPVPCNTFELLLHVVETHVDELLDVVVELEMKLDMVERQLDIGGDKRRDHLKERTFPKMHLDLQRLLQAISHCEVVLPRLHDRLLGRRWCTAEEAAAFNSLMARLRRTKENMGFLASRITALQAGLDQWQTEQINRKLYYLSIMSMVFLPISFITGLFGMNVGGVPWVPQIRENPSTDGGFMIVLWMCLAVVLFTVALIVIGPAVLGIVSQYLSSEALPYWVSKVTHPVRMYYHRVRARAAGLASELGVRVPWLSRVL